MTVVPLGSPDAPLGPLDAPLAAPSPDTAATDSGENANANGFGAALARALDGASGALERADLAERAFIAGHGSLQTMVLERAQADVALSLASAAASRVAQSLGTILGMQV
ncbi:MAG: flagellar hook-basal body complex protein FliE [Candidatus Dormibacteria bacterium]